MKSMNDERFFDLAMKRIADQATAEERAELDAALASKPELKADFDRLRAEARLAKEVLPVIAATEATAGELPGYARERLQTKVRQTLGRPTAEKEPDHALALRWRWVLGLAAATAVIVLVGLPIFRAPNAPVVQVAMLDVAGSTRGTGTNDVALLQEVWKGSPVQNFSSSSELEAWERNWPADGWRSAAKIIYDRTVGEVRVSGHFKGQPFQKTFPVEEDLAATLREVNAFVESRTEDRR